MQFMAMNNCCIGNNGSRNLLLRDNNYYKRNSFAIFRV